MPDKFDCPAGMSDTVSHSNNDTQPGAASTVSGPLESPTSDIDGRAMASSLGKADNAQGTFPTGNTLLSPTDD